MPHLDEKLEEFYEDIIRRNQGEPELKKRKTKSMMVTATRKANASHFFFMLLLLFFTGLC